MCRRLRHPAARDIHAGWHERLSLAVPFGPEEPAARPAPLLASPDAARPLHTLQELAVVQMVRLAGPLAVLDSNLFADGAIPDKMWQALCGSDLGQGNYGAGIIHKRASR